MGGCDDIFARAFAVLRLSLILVHMLCLQEDFSPVPLCLQAQQLLHTICYPAGLPGSLDVSESDHKQLINRVLMVRPCTSSCTANLSSV